ncbi:zinc-ribbon domain-containing protein [[Eubacterium] cellulosolvens]
MVQNQGSEPKYCPKCGEELTLDAIYCLNCGKKVTPPSPPIPTEKPAKPNKAWYLLSIFLTIIGGLIGYFALKGRDKKMAERVLITGVVMMFIWIGLFFGAGAYFYFQAPSPTPSAPAVTSVVTPAPTPITTPAITPTPVPIDTPTATPKTTQTTIIEVEDDRVGISLDKIERRDTLSDEVTESLFKEGPAPSPRSTSDFVILYYTIPTIKNVHLTDIMSEGTVLIDDDGSEYQPLKAVTWGVRFRDPHDIRSEYEFVEGSHGIIVFEIPMSANPEELKVIYSYVEDWEDKDVKYGQLDIKLIR